MHLIKNHANFLNRIISSDSRLAMVLAWVGSILPLAIVSAVMVHFGAPIMNGRPWDVPALLDGAWRVINGQVPYHDFYAHHGPFAFYLTALGMKLSHPCMSAIVYGSVTFMSGLVVCGLVVLSRRTSALYAFLFTLLIGFLVLAPRPLGDPYDFIDHAMIYARYGEAVLLLLSILIFIPPRQQSRSWMDGAEMILAGLLLTILLFTKINYGLLGLAFYGLGIALASLPIRHATFCFLSTMLFSGVFLKISGISLVEMLADYMRAAMGMQGGYRMKVLLIQAAKCGALLPLLLAIIWESTQTTQPVGRQERVRRWIISIGLFGSAILLLASNTQVGRPPCWRVPRCLALRQSGGRKFHCCAMSFSQPCATLVRYAW
jgi:hypothetical protein